MAAITFVKRATLVVAALVSTSCRPTPPEMVLANEFDGAYPKASIPTGPVKEFSIIASETEVDLIDGPKLKVWAYNGQVPGPTLRVRVGDRLRVKFINQLPQETTIHWHGVRLPNNMDGVPHATQPPVSPGGTFIYEFTLKDAGTFWFHPHVRASEQVERGLYGVLIVEDKKPAAFSQDVVWVLDDWLLDENRQIREPFNTRHDLAHDGRWGNAITVNGRTNTVLHVQAGERIRLRIVNSSNGRVYTPDFAGLAAKVIAIDGLYLRAPMDPGRLEIAPGNRVDLDLTFRRDESRLVPIVDRFYGDSPNHLADILIDGIAKPTPAFSSPAHAHVPRWKSGMTMPIAKEFRLNARQGGRFGIEWTINGEAFAGHEHHGTVMSLVSGTWSRLRFINDSARIHPMHIHGMFFKVLARNNVPIDEPFFRDTVLVHGRETIDIGVIPLDEGDWMMHCHILEHAEAGMMTMLNVRR